MSVRMSRVGWFWVLGVLVSPGLWACETFLKQQKGIGEILGSGTPVSSQRRLLSLLWKSSLDPHFKQNPASWTLQSEEMASPVLSEDGQTIYLGGEAQHLTAFRTINGKILWSTTTQGRIVTRPTLSSSLLFVGTTSGMMYAFDRITGKQRWIYQASGEILSPATYMEGTGGQASRLLFTTSNNQVFALQAFDGKWLWKHSHEAVESEQLSIRGQAPVTIVGDKAYTGFSDGSISALEISDGSVLWSKSLKKSERFTDIDAPLVIHQSYLFASAYRGGIHALNLKDGSPVWTYAIDGPSRVEIRDDVLYVSNNEGKVVCLEVFNGKKKWEVRYREAGTFHEPVSREAALFLSSTDGGLYVLSTKDGAILQNLRFARGLHSTPVLAADRLYLFDNTSFLNAFSFTP